MIDNKTIHHIALLARINLDEREEEAIKKQLSSILDYIGQLENVDTKGVEPLYQTAGVVNSTRADEYRKDFNTEDGFGEKLVSQAPERQDGFVKVKSILIR